MRAEVTPQKQASPSRASSPPLPDLGYWMATTKFLAGERERKGIKQPARWGRICPDPWGLASQACEGTKQAQARGRSLARLPRSKRRRLVGADSLLREDFAFSFAVRGSGLVEAAPRGTSSTHVPSVTATRGARRPRYVEDSASCFCLEMSWASFSDRYTSSWGS